MDTVHDGPRKQPTMAEVQEAADNVMREIGKSLKRARSERLRSRLIRRHLAAPEHDRDDSRD
jgi:hypothetical protein